MRAGLAAAALWLALTALPAASADIDGRLRAAEPRLTDPPTSTARSVARRHDLRRLRGEVLRAPGPKTGAARARLRRLEERAETMGLPVRPQRPPASERRSRLIGPPIPRTHLTLEDLR